MADDVEVTSLVPPELAILSSDALDAALPALDAPLRDRYAARLQARREAALHRAPAGRLARASAWSRCRPTIRLPAAPAPTTAWRSGRTAIATQPLVIQGPGAGAEVTAAGLLDDALRLARYGCGPVSGSAQRAERCGHCCASTVTKLAHVFDEVGRATGDTDGTMALATIRPKAMCRETRLQIRRGGSPAKSISLAQLWYDGWQDAHARILAGRVRALPDAGKPQAQAAVDACRRSRCRTARAQPLGSASPWPTSSTSWRRLGQGAWHRRRGGVLVSRRRAQARREWRRVRLARLRHRHRARRHVI